MIESFTRDQEVAGRHCLVCLSKTLYPLLNSTGLTKEEQCQRYRWENGPPKCPSGGVCVLVV